MREIKLLATKVISKSELSVIVQVVYNDSCTTYYEGYLDKFVSLNLEQMDEITFQGVKDKVFNNSDSNFSDGNSNYNLTGEGKALLYHMNPTEYFKGN